MTRKLPVTIRVYQIAFTLLSPRELDNFEWAAIEAVADRLASTDGRITRLRLLIREILDLVRTRARAAAQRQVVLRPHRALPALTDILTYSLRTLRRNPGFSLVAIGTLGLGIGMPATIFNVVNGVLLRPLPYPDQDQVVVVTNVTGEGRLAISEKESIRYRALGGTFTRFGVYEFRAVNLHDAGAGAERVLAGVIDEHVIPALGVTPQLGRNFTAAESSSGGRNAVILSHRFWVNRYGSDAAVLGRSLSLDGSGYDIVGVMPEGFRLPLDFTGTPASVYVPAAIGAPDERNIHYLNSVARLAPGVTVEAGSAAVASTAELLIAEFGTLPNDFSAYVLPVEDEIVGSTRSALLLLMCAVSLVFAIACVNVANLMLARADERQRELSIRQALGAGRSSILALILSEAGMIAISGGVAGTVLCYWATRALIGYSPPGIPRIAGIGFDARVVMFAFGTTTLAALLIGVVPALRGIARARLSGLMDGGRGTAGIGRQRGRRWLLVAEVALAVALTVGAGLTAKSILRLISINPGFDRESVLTMRVDLTGVRYAEQRSARDFYSTLLERVRGYGNVSSAGAVRNLPLSSRTGDWGLRIRGTGPDGLGERGPKADWHVVTDGFFEALGIPLIEGRFFETSDRVGTLNAVIVNETMAETYWPNRSALGAQFRMTTDIDTLWRTVVGVVGDVKQATLDEDVPTAMYLPHSQFPSTAAWSVGPMTVVVRTRGDPNAIARLITDEVHRIDPEVPVSSVRTMNDVVRGASAQQRFQGMLVGTFAIAALVLVSVGIYGVTNYLVGQRFKELGIRVALGASPGRVVRLVLGEGVAVAAMGIILGLSLAAAFGRIMAATLYGVSSVDLQVYGAATAVVTTTALVATYMPARQANAIHAADLLRGE